MVCNMRVALGLTTTILSLSLSFNKVRPKSWIAAHVRSNGKSATESKRGV